MCQVSCCVHSESAWEIIIAKRNDTLIVFLAALLLGLRVDTASRQAVMIDG